MELDAELLAFSTGVTHACLHFGKANEMPLFPLAWEEARAYLRHGECVAGSIGPKIEAALRFLEFGGMRAIITAPEYMAATVRGGAGTDLAADAGVNEPVAA